MNLKGCCWLLLFVAVDDRFCRWFLSDSELGEFCFVPGF